MSLYRKYRPKTFADVIGQDHIVTTLENAAEQNKLSHAYLFAGARGTGKTSVARILAAILLSRGIEDETLQRQIIQSVSDGTVVDLLEIDAASNTGVDNIRDLIEKIQFSPVVASAKVYIIDEVHMLSKGAFNALLKTLEEPPPYAYFILATTELQKIPLTIQSRCQRFSFRQIREEDIVRGLQSIADAEHITIDRGALRAIARHAQGGYRDAISLLDQLRSLEKIAAEDVKERIGESGQEHIDSIFEAVDAGNRQDIVSLVGKIEESGMALDVLARQLLASVREQLHEAIEQGQPTDSIVATLETLLTAVRDIRLSPVPGLVLESVLLSLCSKDTSTGKPAALRKKKDEKEQKEEIPVPDASAAGKEEQKEEQNEETLIEAPAVSLENVRGAWPKVLEETTPPSVRMSLKNGRVLSVEGSKIVVSFASAFHKDKVAKTEASRQVEEVMEKIFRRSLHLECIVESSGSSVKDEKPVDLADAVAEVF